MSGRVLTPSQQQAVRHAEGDASVLAGAGSGKTTVLTERYLALARRPGAQVRRIAALTFTEKAAAEMRERIALAFARAPDLAPRAREVEFAPISTIHAFCARLLREHAVEAGVDPAFELLDETGSTLLREDVFERLERRLRRRTDPRLATLRRLGGENAWRDVLDLHERLRGLEGGVGGGRIVRGGPPLAHALAALRRALDDADVLVAGAGFAAEDLEAHVASRARLPEPAELVQATDEAVRRASRVAKAPYVDDVFALPMKPPKVVRAARATVKEAYGVAVEAMNDEIALRDVDAPLRSLLAEFDAELAREKRRRGVLDFADLERRVLGLLDDLAARRRALPGRPLDLLVDEFQDVNPIQARILERLATSGLARRTELFAVGDPKQSIYRFRGADVSVIERLWQRVGADGRHHLADSFRSRPELVAFHNGFFPARFAQDGGAVPYEPLVARAEFAARETPIPVEFALVVSPNATGRTRSEAEADLVAERVLDWVGGDASRTKQGRADAAPRAIRFGDVAILLRARRNVSVFEQALAARGIPFHTGKGRGYYDTEEMRDLVTLLRVLHDPQDGFAVAAWLTSPAVGATDEDLLAVFGGRRGPPLDAAASRPSLARAVAAVRELRRVAAGSRLEDLLRRALATFDLIPTALVQEGGARRAKNLEKALSIARRLDEEGGHGLLDFLRHLVDVRDREIDEAEAATGASGDVVSLLTVHAAKGLEWPCVIVADTNRPDGGRSPSFLVAPDGGFALRMRDPIDGVTRASGGIAELAELEKVAAARESTRLLYVAMTRAEERLLVTTAVSGWKKDGDPSRLVGWGATVWSALGRHVEPGVHREDVGGAPVDVRVVETIAGTDEVQRRVVPRAARGPVGLDAEGLRAARARIAAPGADLRRTPFVVPISDLLRFAESPARYYDERVVGADPIVRARVPRLEREDPGASPRPDDDEPSGDEAVEDRYDEGRETLEGVDRAALGRAVHLAIERFEPGADVGGVRARGGGRGVPARRSAGGRVRRARDGRALPPLGHGRVVRRGARGGARRPAGGGVPRPHPLSRRGGGGSLPLAVGEGHHRSLDPRGGRPHPGPRPQDELAPRTAPVRRSR